MYWEKKNVANPDRCNMIDRPRIKIHNGYYRSGVYGTHSIWRGKNSLFKIRSCIIQKPKKYSSNVNVAAKCLTPCKNIHGIVLQKKKRNVREHPHIYAFSCTWGKGERKYRIYTPVKWYTNKGRIKRGEKHFVTGCK